jgi:anti-sigma28 factor (negative regulator of flagellin synthesis)
MNLRLNWFQRERQHLSKTKPALIKVDGKLMDYSTYHQQKLVALQKLIESGKYQISSDKIASRIVECSDLANTFFADMKSLFWE